MIGDVKMLTIKQRTERSLTGDRPLFFSAVHCFKNRTKNSMYSSNYIPLHLT